MVDIDGVISLFGAGAPSGLGLGGRPAGTRGEAEGSFHSIEGIPHFLSSTAATHLLGLAAHFELVWASGWEERANEHLPHLLGLPAGLPFLRFSRGVAPGGTAAPGPQLTRAHWKLEAIDTFARRRALAWIDDAFTEECHAWAGGRDAPTLLVATAPERGLTEREAARLEAWARGLAGGQTS